jgi:hypothetical protein
MSWAHHRLYPLSLSPRIFRSPLSWAHHRLDPPSLSLSLSLSLSPHFPLTFVLSSSSVRFAHKCGRVDVASAHGLSGIWLQRTPEPAATLSHCTLSSSSFLSPCQLWVLPVNCESLEEKMAGRLGTSSARDSKFAASLVTTDTYTISLEQRQNICCCGYLQTRCAYLPANLLYSSKLKRRKHWYVLLNTGNTQPLHPLFQSSEDWRKHFFSTKPLFSQQRKNKLLILPSDHEKNWRQETQNWQASFWKTDFIDWIAL